MYGYVNNRSGFYGTSLHPPLRHRCLKIGDNGEDVKVLQMTLMKLARSDPHKGLTTAGTWLGYWWFEGKDVSKIHQNSLPDAYSWAVPDSEMNNNGSSQDKAYIASKGEMYGQFGEPTKIAVIAFQKDEGLPETGEVDAITWEKLGVAGVLCSVKSEEGGKSKQMQFWLVGGGIVLTLGLAYWWLRR